MLIEFDMPKGKQHIIKVIGVGGGGCNSVKHMYSQGIIGVNFIVCNTDAQSLEDSPVSMQVKMGPSITSGLGAGSDPEVGKNAAMESVEDIKRSIGSDTKMVFITTGLGGGTGTGGTPVIARICKEMGLLTIAIVTTPFLFEGSQRMNKALRGIEELRPFVDSIIVISNEKVKEVYGKLSVKEAFLRADNVIGVAARGIAEIITKPGMINLDFSDVKNAMKDSGVAIMGMASAKGDDRAEIAVKEALESPLLNHNDITGAKSVLVNITTSPEHPLEMDELEYITNYIQKSTGGNADLKHGHCYDESVEDNLIVTLIATGFDANNRKSLPGEINQTVTINLEDKMVNTHITEILPPEITHVPAPPVEIIVDSIEHPDFRQATEVKLEEVTTYHTDIINDMDTTLSQEEFNEVKDGKKRQNRLKGLSTYKGHTLTLPAEMENEPAYIRKNINLDEDISVNETQVSRLSLSPSADNPDKAVLRNKNGYIFDGVD